MHVTIIRPDNTVVIDGRVAKVDCSILPNNYHAVQWHGSDGYIETRTGDNIKLESLDSVAAIVAKAQEALAAMDEAAKPTLQRARAMKRAEIDAALLGTLGVASLADVLRLIAAGRVADIQAAVADADRHLAAVERIETIAEVEAYPVSAVSRAAP